MLAPAQWTQRVGALTAIPRLLIAHGAAPSELLAGAGLLPDALDHAENRVPYPAIVQLLTACAGATGCVHFGILAGAQWHLADLGLAGRLARHSEDLGSALETLTVYMRLNNQGAAAYLTKSGGVAELGYAVFHPRVTEISVAYDVAMASAVNQVRDLLDDPRWRPAEVLLPRTAPGDERAYSQHFGISARFNSDRAALRFPASELGRPLPEADAGRKERLLEEADSMLGDEFLLRLHESLRMLLLQGAANSDRVAASLAMHRRTLMRRLARRGTSFQEILDQVRFDVARQLLRETGLSITEIGAALGFSETSAFTHAFRRWSGMSPSEWRNRPSGA